MIGASLAQLNREQQHASERLWQSHLNALQVVAGAGSGKTSTLVAAVQSALAAGYASERIAVITFSRRAAHELKDRLGERGNALGFCGTMHALAWRLIRRAGTQLKIITHTQPLRLRMARQLFPHYAHIAGDVLLRRGFLTESEAATLGNTVARELKSNRQIDFDGLIALATKQKLGQGKFDVLFVDEFQDTAPDQVAFIRSLVPQKLFVVGDDWQSIYRFRGADASLSRNFLREFPGSERALLTTNYRSGRGIVKLGNQAIRLAEKFIKKKLVAHSRERQKPMLYFAADCHSPENAWQRYIRLVEKNGELKKPTQVLVRTNALRRLIEPHLPPQYSATTIHKSKGLEFDNVVVFGVAEDILPHRNNDFDEEVRILYVALTRARHQLGFVAWEKSERRSAFLPFLMRRCRLVYL